jgi:hypothetical protein
MRAGNLSMFILLAAMMAGCATPTEQAARASREVDRMMLVYGPACEKLGFRSNTDPWRNCIIGLSQKDDAYRTNNNIFYGGYNY